jgi:hypothetical protein
MMNFKVSHYRKSTYPPPLSEIISEASDGTGMHAVK